MLETIVIVLIVLWALGFVGGGNGGYRSFGGGYGYPSIGAILVILLLVALFSGRL